MLPIVALLSLAAVANAHVAAWSQKGMFCKGGNNSAVDDQNTNLVVNPLYMLPKNKWWMQADRGCDKVPPKDVMELKAGGTLEVELATNRAFTSLSYGGKYMSDWDDGAQHPEDWHAPGPGKCLGDNPDGKGGELHTTGQADAAGTAFAISYADKLEDVTMENLVVFTTRFHTPWKKNTTYDIPADLPANCPNGRCYCAWLWIPKGCGQPNMYMQNFYCNVVGSTSTKKLATAQPAKWCGDDKTKCVKGAKQMLAWNQAEGNNVVVPNGMSPAYNELMGWTEGAQLDIFEDGPATSASTTASATSTVAPTTLSTQTKPATTTTSAVSSAPASSSVSQSATTKAPATTITTSIRPSTPASSLTTSIRPPASSPPATTSANATTSKSAPTNPAGSCGSHGSHGGY